MNAPLVVPQGLQVPVFEPEHVVWLDFETYFDKEFTLRKMTTAAYVRDPRFETLCVGVKIDGAEAVLMEHEEFKDWSASWQWASTALGAHNSTFESLICAHHYNVYPGFWFDTQSMARALGLEETNLKFLMNYFGVGQKGDELGNSKGRRRKDFNESEFAALGVYCLGDTEGCAAIFEKMNASCTGGFPEAELWLIDTTIRMFAEPQLLLDEPMLKEYMIEEKQRKADLLAQAGLDKKSVGSNEKLAAAFRELGVEPPRKISPTTKKEVYAFAKNDVGMMALLEHETDEVRWLAEARIAVKSTINESRGGRFLQLGKDGQKMCVQLHYYGAHTGRFSGAGKCNFQNLERTNKKDPKKGRLKKSLLAPSGYKVVAVDSGAIEARGVAWLSEHTAMVEAFAQGRDLYSEFASIVYGRQIDRKARAEDEVPGFVGKTCLAAGTLVLTEKRGFVDIVDVRISDRLWDGVEWVNHSGLMDQGVKEVLESRWVAATSDHDILTEHGWVAWSGVLENRSLFQSALLLGFGRQPESNKCNAESSVSKRITRVYDVLSAGPLKRFTILSSEGPLIVSNCTLGLGYSQGGLKLGENFLKGQSGPPVQFTMTEVETLNVDIDKFVQDERKFKAVERMISRLDLETRVIHCAVADHLVKVYRKVNAPIPAFWRFLGDVIRAMDEGIEGYFGPNDCLQTVKNGIVLPNGLMLRYPELRQSRKGDFQLEDGDEDEDEDDWRRKGFSYFDGQKRTRLYGGKLLENICQALARIIVCEQLLHIRAVTGYRPCLSTHDEWAFVPPESEAGALRDFTIQTMKTAPAWARGWPLNAEGGCGKSYGDAK